MLRSLFLSVALLSVSHVAADEVKVEVGRKAPDFTATGLDGKQFKLSDKLNKGKTNVALMFSRANW